VLAATIAAAAMVAQMVIGKATRDALFLSNFPVARLPIALLAGSVVSAGVVRLTTHLLARWVPRASCRSRWRCKASSCSWSGRYRRASSR
jgi:hypothetical protein